MTITQFVVTGLEGIFIAPDFLFSPLFFPCFNKSDCQWTHGFLEKDSKSLKDPRKQMTESKMHSLIHEPFLLKSGLPQYKKQINDCRTTILLHGYLYLSHSSKHSLTTFCVEKCEELFPSKKQKGIRDTHAVNFVTDVG